MRKPTLVDRLEDTTSVADAYRLYDQYVTPRTAHPTQREETERTFFAGVDWALRALTRRAEVGDEDGEEAALWTEARLAETREFARRDLERRGGQ